MELLDPRGAKAEPSSSRATRSRQKAPVARLLCLFSCILPEQDVVFMHSRASIVARQIRMQPSGHFVCFVDFNEWKYFIFIVVMGVDMAYTFKGPQKQGRCIRRANSGLIGLGYVVESNEVTLAMVAE